jgi:hypothetical protein
MIKTEDTDPKTVQPRRHMRGPPNDLTTHPDLITPAAAIATVDSPPR